MKKIVSSILLAIVVTPAAIAMPLESEPGLHPSFGLEGYHYNYRETFNGQYFMDDQGFKYGVYYGLSYQPSNTAFRFAFEGRNAWSSKIRYRSSGTGHHNNSNYQVFETRLLGLYPITCCNQWTLEGYTGLGGRFVANDDEGLLTSTGHSLYLRHSTYAYIPIGARAIKEFDNGIQLVGHVEYDWFLRGMQKSKFDDTFIINNQQHRGYGARAGVDLQIPSSTCVNYTIGAFVRHWNIAKSKAHTFETVNYRIDFFEPKNNTYEVGVRVGMVF